MLEKRSGVICQRGTIAGFLTGNQRRVSASIWERHLSCHNTTRSIRISCTNDTAEIETNVWLFENQSAHTWCQSKTRNKMTWKTFFFSVFSRQNLKCAATVIKEDCCQSSSFLCVCVDQTDECLTVGERVRGGCGSPSKFRCSAGFAIWQTVLNIHLLTSSLLGLYVFPSPWITASFKRSSVRPRVLDRDTKDVCRRNIM